MSKWIRHLAVPIAVLAVVAAACSKKTATSSEGPACTSTLKVGLSLDVGGIGDKSFNDAANRGLNKAITDGLVCKSNTKLIESNSTGSNRDDNTAALASAGYNLVVATGFAFTPGVAGSPTTGPGIASQYPDVNFAVIDGYATCGSACALNDAAPNVADLDFKEQEGSYLVGIAAALQAKKDGSKTVGFLGGQSGQGLIEKFQAGYTAGVQSVDPNIKVLVEYIGTDVTAFNDPTKGKTLSVKMYGEGADVIYHAAGGSGSGLFQAAVDAKKFAIGVDSDQYLTASPDQQPYILTSMLKRVDVATYNAIKKFQAGPQVFGLAEEGLAYSTANSALSPDMVTAMEAAKAKIIDGSITVPTVPAK